MINNLTKISELSEYLLQHTEELFQLGKDEYDECTALAYSHRLRKRNDYLETLMQDYGMETRYDAVGNLFGRLEGESSKTILILSHIDTVVNAGRFDGVLGVLLGILVCKELKKAKNLKYSIEVLVCMGEESPGVTATFGSKCITGHYTDSDFRRMKLAYDNTITVNQAIKTFLSGIEPKNKTLESSQLKKNKYISAIEIHSEQYYTLQWLSEKRNRTPQIGIMSGVGGHLRTWVTIGQKASSKSNLDHYSILYGKAGHSGATPMGDDYREDALLKFSKFWINESSKNGLNSLEYWMEVIPNSRTSIPSEIRIHHPKLNPQQKDAFHSVFNKVNCFEENAQKRAITANSLSKIASIVMATNEKVIRFGDNNLRGTVTQLDLDNEIKLFIDIRGASNKNMQSVFEKIILHTGIQEENIDVISQKSPSIFDKNLTDRVIEVLDNVLEGNIQTGEISVPGQDIGVINNYGIPSTLLFVESNTGHHPDEHVRKKAIDQAFRALFSYLNLIMDRQISDYGY
jgi:hypothetical protein